MFLYINIIKYITIIIIVYFYIYDRILYDIIRQSSFMLCIKNHWYMPNSIEPIFYFIHNVFNIPDINSQSVNAVFTNLNFNTVLSNICNLNKI